MFCSSTIDFIPWQHFLGQTITDMICSAVVSSFWIYLLLVTCVIGIPITFWKTNIAFQLVYPSCFNVVSVCRPDTRWTSTFFFQSVIGMPMTQVTNNKTIQKRFTTAEHIISAIIVPRKCCHIIKSIVFEQNMLGSLFLATVCQHQNRVSVWHGCSKPNEHWGRCKCCMRVVLFKMVCFLF